MYMKKDLVLEKHITKNKSNNNLLCLKYYQRDIYYNMPLFYKIATACILMRLIKRENGIQIDAINFVKPL